MHLLGVHFATAIDGLDHGGFQVIGVQPTDEGDANPFWALSFALGVVAATTEAFGLHLIDHVLGSIVSLGLSLRKHSQVSRFGRGEQHR